MVVDFDEASDILSHDGEKLGKVEMTSEEFISPLSRTSEVGTANQKQAIMKMIAQEMVQAFVEPTLDVENTESVLQSRFEDTVKKQRLQKKAEQRRLNQQKSGLSELTMDTFDPTEGSKERRARLKAQRWNSIEGSEYLPPPDRQKITERPTKPVRTESAMGGGLTDSFRADSTNSTSVIEDELSIEEIRRFVINNIPQAMREQIPEEAWAKIFGGAASKGGSGVSRRSLGQASDSSDREQSNYELDVGPDDDMSAISGLTGLTSAFPDGKSIESRIMSIHSRDLESKVEDDPEPDASEDQPESARFSLAEGSVEMKNSSKESTLGGKGVFFDAVEVRYYERTGADNPAVTSGPAVGIGWNYKRGGRQSLSTWESRKGGPPLKSYELLMDRAEREDILRSAGYTQKDIAEIVRKCLKGRNQRQQTVNNLKHASMEEAVESAQQRIAKIMRFGKKKSLIK